MVTWARRAKRLWSVFQPGERLGDPRDPLVHGRHLRAQNLHVGIERPDRRAAIRSLDHCHPIHLTDWRERYDFEGVALALWAFR